MFPWCHNMKNNQSQSGMTLIITLLLLLSLLMMASAITYITMSYANLADSVTHKPLAIDAAETCSDKGFEWLSITSGFPSGGKDWVNGTGAATDLASSGMPLYGYNIITDTIPQGMGESRSAPLLNVAGRTRCNSVVIEKLAPISLGTGSEIGTSDYSRSQTTIIKITASGLFDVPLKVDGVSIDNASWRPSSSQAKIEVIAEFNP
jgi:hypothetical protein